METTYSVKSTDEGQTPCCCCEDCKCKCSGRGRKASIHVSNKFLAGSSGNRRKTRNASVPSISVTKPKVSVHINARVSLSAYPISESPSPSPEESPRVGFLSESGTWWTKMNLLQQNVKRSDLISWNTDWSEHFTSKYLRDEIEKKFFATWTRCVSCSEHAFGVVQIVTAKESQSLGTQVHYKSL